jgi:hypothetical protein
MERNMRTGSIRMMPFICASCPAANREPEVDFHIDLYCHRYAVFPTGLEPPLANGFDRPFIQPHAERALHSDVVRTAVCPNNHPENYGALILGLKRLLRELGIRGVDYSRCRSPRRQRALWRYEFVAVPSTSAATRLGRRRWKDIGAHLSDQLNDLLTNLLPVTDDVLA